jgi:ribosomal protein S18 acetylase RimI-like enzyme
MNCRFRPIVQSDEPFLWEMLYQAVYVSLGSQPLPREAIYQPELARYVEGWGREHDSGIVAIDDRDGKQQPIGAAWLRAWTGLDQGYGFIDAQTPELSMAVLPEYRGRRGGTRLLERLLADADQVYPALSLSVSPNNPAYRLYLRFGFSVVTSDGSSLTMRRIRAADLK